MARDQFLMMEMLHFASDVIDISELGDWKNAAPKAKIQPQEVQMAEQLIEDMTTKWKPADYKDTYRQDIMKQVQAKVKAGKATEITEDFVEKEGHKSKLDRPDQIIFDLDPDEKLEWDKVLEAAFRIKDLLKKLSLESYVKTTGGKGLHIHVPITPIYNWDQIKSFSKSVTMQLESEYPKEYTTNISKKKRSGKIFLDYLRNGFGATAIAPYSLRAKNKPTVSVPLTWAEVRKLKKPDDFDLNSVLERLVRQKTDPWKGYDQMKQKIKILKPASSLKKSKSEKSDFDEKENSLF